ncbi:MAG: DUF6691 family protein [Chthoniobacterales bacterium]
MKPTTSGKVARAGRQLLLGLVFGGIFGFLLQKGGVGKYHILIGQLLLRDFTVTKVMGTAIVVGMIGVFAMHWMGLVKLHIKATRIGANTIGGLIFGAGFALSAYCPGTNMTALGQGNLDALFVVAGMLVGSYLYAEVSGRTKGTIEQWGNRGELTLPGLFGLPGKPFVAVFAVVIVAGLLALAKLTIR